MSETTFQVDYSTGESLVLSNPDFQIRQLMEFAPRDLQCREAGQNCFEAFQHSDEEVRRIFIRAIKFGDFKAAKLSFLNSGVGMTREQLALLSNINNTLKTIGIITDNRGEGIKVAGCANNPLGIWWFTRKDGRYYASSIGIDPVSKAWKRARVLTHEGYVSAWEIEHPSQEEIARWPAEGDFVEVVFLGSQPDQDTFVDPRGMNERRTDSVWNDLMMRYYAKPKIDRVTIPSEIRYQDDVNGDPLGGVEILFTDEVIYRTPRDYDEATALIEDGVQIRYVLAKTDIAARRLGTGGHMAVVFQSEKYDVHSGNAWSRISPSFGISQVQNNLCVFVVLPDDYGCYGDRYRKHLIQQNNKQPLNCEAFRLDIAQNIPDWLQKKMSSPSKPSGNNTQAKLKGFLSHLPFLRKLGLTGGDYMTGRGSVSNGNGAPRKPGTSKGTNPNNGTTVKGIAHPAGRSQAVAMPPAIRWLPAADLGDIENSGLRGRIAEFRPGPTGGTLVLNEFSPTFRMLVAMLLKIAEIPDGLESFAYKEAVPLLKNKTEYRLSQCILVRQSMKGSLDWTDSQIESCLTHEGLENFATAIFPELKLLTRNLLSAPSYRVALSQHSGTSPNAIVQTKSVSLDGDDDAVDAEDDFIHFP